MLIALDRQSARSKSVEGHLTVKHCLLSRAIVSEYDGSEIPDASDLGWKPGTVYRLYRDPAALKAATPGLEGKPLLLEHRPVDARNHPKQITIGTVTNPSYENGSVFGDLVIWDQNAIDAIESRELPALSCGYRYRCDPTSGTAPDGESYDGRMLDIAMNHVALVELRGFPTPSWPTPPPAFHFRTWEN